MPVRRIRPAGRAIVVASLAATTVLVAAPAHAATTGTLSGGVLTVTLGSATGLTVLPDDGAYEVDSTEGISSLSGCARNEIGRWRCAAVTRVVVHGSSGADDLSLTGDFVVEARLGAGDDDLFASENRKVTAYGEGGADYLDISVHGAPSQLQGSHLDGGDGNDQLFGGPANDTLVGGAGNDRMAGKEGNDTVLGGEGHDEIYGDHNDGSHRDTDGDDALGGDAGDDVMNGGGGADVFRGGDGTDTVSYDHAYDYSAPLVFRATLDGLPDDGVTGEGDNIGADGGVENLDVDAFGTFASMTVVGNDARNVVTGAPSGTITVDLRGGNDSFEGGASGGGTISVTGGDGDDVVSAWGRFVHVDGGAGRDTLKTSEGDSTIIGGPGQDSILAGRGNDTIRARDNEVDSISCGIGADTLVADGTDVVNADPLALCESQDISPATSGQGSGASGNPAVVKGQVTIAVTARTKVSKRGVARFKVANGLSKAVTLKAVLTSKKPRTRVGTTKARIRSGAKGVIKVRLGAKALRLLKRKGSLKVTVTVTAVSGARGKLVRTTRLTR